MINTHNAVAKTWWILPAASPKEISLLWIAPFVAVLLCVAVIPHVNSRWWHRNYKSLSFAFAVPIIGIMFFVMRERTVRALIDYISFVALIVSLYTIAGGIEVRGKFKSGPAANTIVLLAGTLLASMFGSPCASMILIRFLIRLNRHRKRVAHIFIFHIFLVCNIGGALTPLGNPPLFLGFLQGVPFGWPIRHCFPGWLFTVSAVLAIFYVIEMMAVKSDEEIEAVKHSGHKKKIHHKDEDADERGAFRIAGRVNFLFLAGILSFVLLSSEYIPASWGLFGDLARAGVMILMAAFSWLLTPKKIRERNDFNLKPVVEVSILFAAIFACMIPALNILEYKSLHGQISLERPWEYFWLSGGLSSVLDNSPTYMTFLTLGKTVGGAGCVAVSGGCVPAQVLLAVSLGASFMGAMNYIGNAQNLMARSICKEFGIDMPSFFGYLLWSSTILLPVFIAVTIIFFR